MCAAIVPNSPQRTWAARRRQAEYDDLVAVPDGTVAELIDGQIVTSPRPGPRHANASMRLGVILSPLLEGMGEPGGWVLLAEPELHLGADVVVPDLAAWRAEHMPALPETAHFALAPDWVCEVISPSSEAVDRVRKMAIYARERVAYAWLLSPDARILEVYGLEAAHWVRLAVHEGDAHVALPPFEAVTIPMDCLWRISFPRRV